MGNAVATVFRHEFRALFLSPRVRVPMMIYAGFGALAVLLFLEAKPFLEQIVARNGGGEADRTTALEWFLAAFGFGDTGTALAITQARVPSLITFFFVTASYFLPMLVALVAFDQFSELSTRGARFPLLKVQRESYFVGKALAAAGAVAGFLGAMWLVIVAVAIWRGGLDVAWLAVREGVRSWLLMCVLSLPYLALTALISSFARPSMAFAGTFAAYVAQWLLKGFLKYLPDLGAYLARRTVGAADEGWRAAAPQKVQAALQSVSDLAMELFPFQHAPGLVSRYAPKVLGATGALLLIALVVYGVTGTFIRRRDV